MSTLTLAAELAAKTQPYPNDSPECPMCTAFIGALDTPSRDLSQRIAVAIIGRSPVSRQLAFARERGWRNLKFYQCIGDDFPCDYRGLAAHRIPARTRAARPTPRRCGISSTSRRADAAPTGIPSCLTDRRRSGPRRAAWP